MDNLVKTTEEPIKPVVDNLVVIASKPDEMANAQSSLIEWFDKKIKLCEAELDEARTNLELAKDRKWQTRGWKTIVVRTEQAVTYYTKARSALAEGFSLIPDFPIDIIAIRTTAKGPRPNCNESTWRNPSITDQQTNSPKEGEGRYVSPSALVVTDSYKKEVPDKKPETVHTIAAVGFLPPDFPYRLVKPRVLDETSRAMAFKVFDEIGVVRKTPKAPDPIVVGRVTRKVGNSIKSMSFLISWWIDTRDL